MTGLFCYRWVHESAAALEIIFKPPGCSSSAEMATALSSAAQGVLYPDGVVIICLRSDKQAALDLLGTSRVNQSIARFRGKSSVHLLVADITGKPVEMVAIQTVAVTDGVCILPTMTAAFPSVVAAGVHTVFSQRGVVVPAPSGFEFVKPSGDRSSHFLRAEEALSTSASVDFLAFALLSRIKLDDLKVIFVDTMAIASVAYAVREMRSQAGKPIPQIISFHSHDGLTALSTPTHKTFFCIISASSSLSLERKWISHTRCTEDDVVTLLTFTDVFGSRGSLCAVTRPEDWKNEAVPVAGVRALRIFGERFQPEQIPAKKISLTLKPHRYEEVEQFAEEFCGCPLLSINGLDDTGVRRTLFADGSVLVASPSFEKWLHKQLRSKVPASIQGIIFQDDAASEAMADKCREILVGMGVTLPWGIHDSSEFESKLSDIDPHRALLVVAAVVGKGAKLLGVARDLRATHFGAKTFLLGLQICETESNASFLKRNLQQSKDKTNSFESFHVLASGEALQQSLRAEEDAVRFDDGRSDVLRYRWDPRRKTGLIEDALLPSLVPDHHRLALRPDFVFWNCKYAEGSQHAPMVLASIGAILERARTHQFQSDDHRLSSDAFQQVVLDPQNFNRYNDGIIQAAILRQAYPSELDFSSLPDDSRFMLLFLKKLFAARRTQQGEAAAEFAFAIGTGRLRLHPQDLKTLMVSITDTLTTQPGDAELQWLLQLTNGANAQSQVI